MSAGEFSDLVALSQVTPGPMAVNAATYVGFNSEGVLGSVIATVAVALPGFLLVLIAMLFIERFKNSTVMKGIFKGIRPATVGLIFSCMIFVASGTLVKESFSGNVAEYINVLPICIFICTIILAGKFKISPIIVILLMGAAGTCFYGFIM